MLTTVLAVRTSWVGILIILGCVGIAWLLLRAVYDLIVWFKEEIIDDFRENRSK